MSKIFNFFRFDKMNLTQFTLSEHKFFFLHLISLSGTSTFPPVANIRNLAICYSPRADGISTNSDAPSNKKNWALSIVVCDVHLLFSYERGSWIASHFQYRPMPLLCELVSIARIAKSWLVFVLQQRANMHTSKKDAKNIQVVWNVAYMYWHIKCRYKSRVALNTFLNTFFNHWATSVLTNIQWVNNDWWYLNWQQHKLT